MQGALVGFKILHGLLMGATEKATGLERKTKESYFRKTETRTKIWARKIHYKHIIHYK